ncbi:polyphosphate glucokinase, partial [Leucobacter chromiiresistens]
MGVQHAAIGIDVGGTGIKGAAIDVATGDKITARHKVATPAGGAPADIAAAVGRMAAAIRAELAAGGFAGAETLPVGVTLPGVVRDGVMRTAANID